MMNVSKMKKSLNQFFILPEERKENNGELNLLHH